MIDASDFLSAARAAGFDFYTGVPCSLLTSLLKRLAADSASDYVGATSEGEACGIAAGAWLAGKNPIVMLQNSGLGNTVNPLTSLNHPFRIPCLLLVTWRGEPGTKDEPQHAVMGEMTHRLLETIRIAHAPFPATAADLGSDLAAAQRHMAQTQLPYAFVVRKSDIGGQAAYPPVLQRSLVSPAASDESERQAASGPSITRFEALRAIVETLPSSAAIIATTGKTGRELFTICDREQHLYLVGSMGCASAVGLGVALNVHRPVVIVDGDGAALMKLGNLATIGARKPANLLHIILDNGVHDSTGGQATASSTVNFAQIAHAAGYRSAAKCLTLADLRRAGEAAVGAPGPHLVCVKIEPGSINDLGRPTVAPPVIARRFRKFLTGQSLSLPQADRSDVAVSRGDPPAQLAEPSGAELCR